MNISTIPYGAPPVDLGLVPLDPTEMLVYLYLPIKMAGEDQKSVLRQVGSDALPSHHVRLPERLDFLGDLVWKAIEDAGRTIDLADHYIYLTVKTLWVEGSFSGNRPGWHADGYGSNGDLNYIWHNITIVS